MYLKKRISETLAEGYYEINKISGSFTKIVNVYEATSLTHASPTECNLLTSELAKKGYYWNSTTEQLERSFNEGISVLISNNGTCWELQRYKRSSSYKYIVPVSEFNFSDFESNAKE